MHAPMEGHPLFWLLSYPFQNKRSGNSSFAHFSYYNA
jgi:hypothetical protein